MDKQQTAVKNFLMKAYYMDERINSKLVWDDMEPGTVSADGGQALEAGTGIWDCGGATHLGSRYCG